MGVVVLTEAESALVSGVRMLLSGLPADRCVAVLKKALMDARDDLDAVEAGAAQAEEAKIPDLQRQ